MASSSWSTASSRRPPGCATGRGGRHRGALAASALASRWAGSWAMPATVRTSLRGRPATRASRGLGRGTRTEAGLGQGAEQVAALLGTGHGAEDVQAVGDEGVFEFQHRVPELVDLVLARFWGPLGFRGGELELGGLGLDERGERGALVDLVGRQGAPALDGGLQIEQAPVEAGLGQRRGEVADQGGGGAALGDGALGGVVGGVEVEVGQVADQRSGQQAAESPACLPGMNSSAPWVPKCSTAWASRSSRR